MIRNSIMSEESEKKNSSKRNHCGTFQVEEWLSRPKSWQLQILAR